MRHTGSEKTLQTILKRVGAGLSSCDVTHYKDSVYVRMWTGDFDLQFVRALARHFGVKSTQVSFHSWYKDGEGGVEFCLIRDKEQGFEGPDGGKR